jgi:hypothetical protein
MTPRTLRLHVRTSADPILRVFSPYTRVSDLEIHPTDTDFPSAAVFPDADMPIVITFNHPHAVYYVVQVPWLCAWLGCQVRYPPWA